MAHKTPLRDFLDRAEITAEAFADKHGFSPWSMRHWARGDKFPNRDAQIKMGELTGGAAGPEAWLTWSLAKPPAEHSNQSAAA